MGSNEATTAPAKKEIINHAAKGFSFFTPAQNPPAGFAPNPQPDGSTPPPLFTTLKIRGLELHNRIMLSPLCQYSTAHSGPNQAAMTPWHMAHLGGIASRGPALVMVEATGVTPEGRISPQDHGLWNETQMEAAKKVVEFVHSQNQKIGIQLGHAGRKGSTVAPWIGRDNMAPESDGGWANDIIGPSAIPYASHSATPKAMTLDDIAAFKAAFKHSVELSLRAGFDVIEIHSAHGYLLHEFLSPVSNHRTDAYGGSFENRVRLTLEVAELVRATVPEDYPVFLRISATDWLEDVEEFGANSWKVEDTVRLAPLLAERGIDLLDVSSGGNHPKQHIVTGWLYQKPFADAVKKELGDKLLVGTVGSIKTGKDANTAITDGLDLAIVGRQFQYNPGLVFEMARELGVKINYPNQIWGFGPPKL